MSFSNSIKFPLLLILGSLQHKISLYESFEIMEFYNKWWNYITPLLEFQFPLYLIMMEKLHFIKFPLF